MPSRPRASAGSWRLSAAFILLVSGIAAAFIFGPLLQIKWFEGEIPFSPYRVQPTAAKSYVTRKVDIADGYAFTWVERKTERRAPALALRVTPLDFSGWWSTAHAVKQVGEAGDGPEMLVLYVLVPGAEGVPFEGTAPLCTERQGPFGGCRIGQADVIVRRDDGDWAKHDILLGRRTAQPNEAVPLDHRPVRVLREFWTSREPGGRLRFRGWTCTAEQLAAERRELGPLPKADAPLMEHVRCFEPARAWERWLPSRFGYERQRVLFECQPKSERDCHAYFLFHGRFADVRVLWWPAEEEAQTREQTRLRLFLASWEMLNRLHEEARSPSGGARYLAEAREQAAVCKALAREAQSWGSAMRRDWFVNPMLPCYRAGAIATRYAKDAPAQAEPLLAELADLLRRTEGRDSRWERLVEARIEALAAAGRRDSPEMLHVLASFYGETSYSKGSKDFERHGEAMKHGWSLARKYRQQAPAERDRLQQALAGYYMAEGNPQAVLGVYQELLADLEQDGGPLSAQLAPPLQRLATYQWHQGAFLPMRHTLDRLRVVWLARPENLSAAADSFEERRREQEIGFRIVFLYSAYALNQLAHAEVTPLVREVTGRMERTLGAANPYLRAARFHEQEIVTRKAAPAGTPIGGGLLP